MLIHQTLNEGGADQRKVSVGHGGPAGAVDVGTGRHVEAAQCGGGGTETGDGVDCTDDVGKVFERSETTPRFGHCPANRQLPGKNQRDSGGGAAEKRGDAAGGGEKVGRGECDCS